MRPKPTKEEVEDWKIAIAKQKTSDESVAILFKDDASRLCEAYLALREEVERVNGTLEAAQIVLRSNQRRVLELEADNEALREKLAQVEQASQRIIGNIIGEQTHGTY